MFFIIVVIIQALNHLKAVTKQHMKNMFYKQQKQ